MEFQNLNTKFLGRNVICYQKIDSTQLEIWRRIQKREIKNGTIIITQTQTNGQRNTWQKMVYK